MEEQEDPRAADNRDVVRIRDPGSERMILETASLPIWCILGLDPTEPPHNFPRPVVALLAYDTPEVDEKRAGGTLTVLEAPQMAEPSQLFARSDQDFEFAPGLIERLPPSRRFWIFHTTVSDGAVPVRWSQAEEAFGPIQLLRDRLPEHITPDVFLFPQRVLTAHMAGSFSAVSKRHRATLKKTGRHWCVKPNFCKYRKRCTCHAFPSRHVRKLLREFHMSLVETGAPPDMCTICKSLLDEVSVSTRLQLKRNARFEDFQRARVRRWTALVCLKRYTTICEVSEEIREEFEALWHVTQADNNPDNLFE